MNKPHKHAELIKAWADGAEIQWLGDAGRGRRATRNGEEWFDVSHPSWAEGTCYRIKPPPPKTYGEIARDAWHHIDPLGDYKTCWEVCAKAAIDAYLERELGVKK